MDTFVGRIKTFFETIRISPLQWTVSFGAIMIIRFFLEAFSSPSSSGIIASDLPTLTHYFLWFLTLALSLMLFMQIVLPEWKKALFAATLFGFMITWLAPIIDFIVSRGHGSKMTYLFQDWSHLFDSYFTFFGAPRYGITIGIHIEVILVLIFFATIYYFTKKNIKKTIGVTLILYSIFFIFVSAPSLIYIFDTQPGSPINSMIDTVTKSSTIFDNLHGNLRYGTKISLIETGFDYFMSRIYIVATTILLSILFFINKRTVFIAIIKNSRPERVIHYWLMAGLGMYLAWHISPWHTFNINDIFVFISLFLAIYGAWMFSVCTNDITDTTIDTVSNSGRPLPSKSVEESDMRTASQIFLLISIGASYLAGYYAFFATIVFIALYYIYSMQPTRLKRVPFLSTFLISLACASMMVAGFFTFSQSKITSILPITAIIGIIVVSFFWAHIRDLKDIAGDQQEGILTVPVLFGKVWGPRIVAIFGGLAYIFAGIFIKNISVYVLSVIWAFATYYFCIRTPYKEKPLFILYFLWVILTIIILSTEY
ncbi:MAG TPA: UbiA family prenyltransferase [Candidatus Paceibacterota bacterium]|jgi:4-hydroxybenzoate polyprenyltransferase|nr:UbiA family prenyltransferase [Candidatus Paceibacterota bacterium]